MSLCHRGAAHAAWNDACIELSFEIWCLRKFERQAIWKHDQTRSMHRSRRRECGLEAQRQSNFTSPMHRNVPWENFKRFEIKVLTDFGPSFWRHPSKSGLPWGRRHRGLGTFQGLDFSDSPDTSGGPAASNFSGLSIPFSDTSGKTLFERPFLKRKKLKMKKTVEQI